ncbi:TonB-dependent receptor [Alteromonas sp. 1_MG-2023]|uniref:TonB-dependent receptor n=1 Tax=Alteromonas sp. 1_MG-2023 TaxID=3062669 RepID=UPI0026E38E68|nr:TonB-dependent receptor [Alteromonas sp. 1_MG-2023]MDO6477001.1 TonB-dependent receptor [Alteromonas sp. 1_MG-2023]
MKSAIHYPRPSVFAKSLLSLSVGLCLQSAYAQELEKITVTAQHREENLQEVPIAITALSEQDIALRNMTDTLSINETVPNINVAKNPGSTGGMKVFIRGIGEDESRVGADPAVGIYIDDVYIGRQTAALTDLADIQGIEILRGPQGTLYGRNSNGGAIRITTRQPSLDDHTTINLTTGSDSIVNGYLLVNKALSANLAGQVSVFSKNRDGFITNLDTGERLGDVDKSGARVALKYYGDIWDLAWQADFLRDLSEPGYPVLRNDDDGNWFTTSQSEFPVSALINGDTQLGEFYNRLHQRGTSFKAHRQFGDVTFDSITAYRAFEHEMLTIVIAPFLQEINQDQISQEFRFAKQGDNYDWLTGLYLYREDASQYSEFFFGSSDVDLITESAAVFGQYTHYVSSALKLTGGLRYTFEDKNYTAEASEDYWSAQGRANTGEQSENWGNLSWKLVAAYDLNEATMLYASVTTGFKSGGWSTDGFQPVNEETVETYEAGFKSDLTKSFRLNANLYYNDYTDLQINGTTENGVTRVNAGDVETYGIEVAATWLATEDLTFDAYLGTTEGKYKRVSPAAAMLIDSSMELKQAPPLSYGVNAKYFKELGTGELIVNVQYAYTDKQYNDLANTEALVRDETDIVNLRIGYNWGSETEYSVALWSKNLLDEEYAAVATTSNGAVYPGDPVTYGVDFSLKF